MALIQPSIRAQIITRRTYQRPKNEEGTEFETWDEVIGRVISHQRWLWERALTHKLMPEMPLHDITENLNEWVKLSKEQEDELKELRELFLERKAAPAGRTLWLGGTPIGKQVELSQFNCCFVEVKTVHDVVDFFWGLLNGAGVTGLASAGTLTGFRSKINKLTIIRTKRGPYDKGPEDNSEEWNPDTHTWTIKLGDSARAWAKSVGKLLAGKFPAKELILDFTNIRGAGARLRNYGWISQSDAGLSKAYSKIFEILNARADCLLTEIDIGDIINLLGTVLSTRRAAEALLMNKDNPRWKEFARSKQGIWENGKEHRAQSNNSLLFYSKPTLEELYGFFDMINQGGNGEPGLVNAKHMKDRAPWASGLNPCFEVLLADGNTCNLVTIDLGKFAEDNSGLLRAAKIITRANYRQTVVDFRDGILQEKWHLNNDHLHLCGVSLMGIAMRPDMQPYDYKRLERTIIHAGYGMAEELGTPYPKNLTVNKPEGCQLGSDYISTNKGLITFDELVDNSTFADNWGTPNESLIALGSNKPITKVYNNGVKDIHEITTRYGFTCYSTSQHPWYVKDEGWVEADSIVPGDKLALDFVQIPTRVVSLESIEQAVHGSTRVITQPTILSTDLSWLLGFYFGNGSIANNYLYLYSQYSKILEKASRILQEEFNLSTSIVKCDNKDMYRLTIGSSNLIDWLTKNGFIKYNSDKEFRSIPRKVRGSKDTSIAFLAGLIDSDGCVTKNSGTKLIKISTTHKEFSESVQNTAMSCGILLSRSNTQRNTTKGFVEYDCTLQTTVLLNNWDILSSNSVKISTESNYVDIRWRHESTRQPMPLTVISNKVVGKENTWGIEVEEEHWYLSNGGIRTHNTISKCFDSTEGMHKPLGKYIFNNVAFSVHDPLVKKLQEANYNVFVHPYDPTAMLATFPVKYDTVEFDIVNGVEVNLESAISQLERYKTLMQHYCEQNVSCTISYSLEETDDIVNWLFNNWDSYVAVSFLFRNDPTKTAKDLGYPYLPQEVVTKEVYDEYVKQLKEIDLNVQVDDSILESDCAGGVCPIR